MKVFCIFMVLYALPFGANIVSDAGGGVRTIISTKDYYRTVTVYSDPEGGIRPAEMHCRVYKYNSGSAKLPLVVMPVCWGGTLDNTESVMEYESTMNDPFITIVIMPENNTYGTEFNTRNWYWGNIWDSAGTTWSVPWAHNAFIDIMNDLKAGRLDSILLGNTIDTNRIYISGNSIGGTATAQIGIKHPEIFAALSSHVGWTRYWADDGSNAFFGDSRGCLMFTLLVGGTDASAPAYCLPNSSVVIRGNADQRHLPLSSTRYAAYRYTDLNWYFNKTGEVWNYRDPGFETPFVYHTTGSQDDPENQGDNLIPAMDVSRRGFMYHRVNDGHPGGGFIIHWNWLRNFRKDQSYLAFTNRSYDDFSIVGGSGTGIGYMNDLTHHGWDHTTIIDEPNHYYVKLTGTGTADVTLRRLQNLVHTPGTVYDLTINGTSSGQVTADAYGLLTIPAVSGDAAIELFSQGTGLARQEIRDSAVYITCRPNPFNPTVTITLRGHNALVREPVQIFDISGRMVASLAGTHDHICIWDASGYPSGIYIVNINLEGKAYSRQVMLMK